MRLLLLALVFAACSAPAPADSGVIDSGVADSGPDAGQQPVTPVPVRVMTWNVRQLGADGGSPQRVAELIAAQSPELVTVQELSSVATFTALEALLRAQGYDGHAGELAPGSGDLLQAVFWKRATVTVTSAQNVFSTDGQRFPRPPLAWRTTLTARDAGFSVVAVHLKAGIRPADEQTRIDALGALDGWLRDRIDAGEPDWLLLGDFNEAPSDPRSAEAFAPFVREPAVFRALTPGLADAGVFTFVPRMILLDHVVATATLDGERDGGLPAALRLDQTVADFAAVSDHLPLVLDLQL